MKQRQNIQFITITAMAIALTYVFTAFVNVRLPIAANGGLIHLGNVPLFFMAMIFGRKTGMIAGGAGMGLFDLLSGWTLWAPFTFVIVGCMGYVVGKISEEKKQIQWKAISLILACAIKIVGYYIAEGIIYGNWMAPMASIPGNLVQVGVASAFVLVAIKPVESASSSIGLHQFA